MTSHSLSDTELASAVASLVQRWTAISEGKDRNLALLKAGVDGRLLRELPWSAPTEEFALILAYQLVAALGTDQTHRRSIESLIAATSSEDAEQAVSVRRELQRRATATQVQSATVVASATPPSMQGYLEAVVQRLGTVDTTFLGPAAPNRVPIDQLYVALPTGARLLASVGSDLSVSWSISGIRSASRMAENSSTSDPFVPRLADALNQVRTAVGDEPASLPGEATRPLVLRPLANGDPFEIDTLRVEEVVAQFNRVLLTGAPGAGKSTAAKHTTVAAARRALGGTRDAGERTDLVPLFIEVSALSRWSEFVNLAKRKQDVITQYANQVSFGGDSSRNDDIRNLARAGRLLVVIDGLDEVWMHQDDAKGGVDRRLLLAGALERFFLDYPSTPSLITCRPEAEQRVWLSLSRCEFVSVELPPIRADYAELLVERFLDLCCAGDREQPRARIRSLWTGGVAAVLSVPLYVALFAATLTSDSEVALRSRSALLGEAVRLLAIRWSSSRSASELHGYPEAVLDRTEAEAQLIAALQRIALQSLMDSDLLVTDASGIKSGALLGELIYFRNGMYSTFTYLTEESGLFECIGDGLYRFRLRPFEEFLGASELVRQGGKPLDVYKDAMRNGPERWLEPVALACDLLADRLGPAAAAAALGDVVLDWSSIDGRSEGDWSCLWLAATAIGRLVDDHALTTNRGTCLRLRDRIRQGFPTANDISHFGRCQVGETVAALGDPRVGVGTANGAPVFDWVELPAGAVLLGTTQDDEVAIWASRWSAHWSVAFEQPAVEVPVASFAISRYPVTVEQYREFLEGDQGYADDRWWHGLIRPNAPPSLPRAANRRSDPVTQVNWYESVAFARWASARLSQQVRLPTELEWEFAARGAIDSVRRLFPWGSEYDSRRCNGQDSGIGRPTPVGIYGMLDGPWGERTPLDMSGNVWEWCSTIHSIEGGAEYRYPYVSADGRESMEAADTYRRVVRGGSFTNQPFMLRTGMRGHDRPSLRAARQGFRVVKIV